MACAVLHNIAIRGRIPEPDNEELEVDYGAVDNHQGRLVDERGGGVQTRQRLIDNHFTIGV